MKITVPTTSATLLSILSADQKAQVNVARDHDVRKCIIQVLGAQDIYVDFGDDAAVATGLKIAQNGVLEFEEYNLADVHLIADTTPNTDVRVLIN